MVSRFCAAKVKLVGDNDALGPPLVPVPVSATDCGLPVALSDTAIVAVRVPTTVGVRVTLIVQFARPATDRRAIVRLRKVSRVRARDGDARNRERAIADVEKCQFPLTGLEVPTPCAAKM